MVFSTPTLYQRGPLKLKQKVENRIRPLTKKQQPGMKSSITFEEEEEPAYFGTFSSSSTTPI